MQKQTRRPNAPKVPRKPRSQKRLSASAPHPNEYVDEAELTPSPAPTPTPEPKPTANATSKATDKSCGSN